MADSRHTTRRGVLRAIPALAVASMGPACAEAVFAGQELPVRKVTRLGVELSDALAGYHDGECTAVVFPARDDMLPVSLVIDRRHNETMRLVYEYRDAHRRMVTSANRSGKASATSRRQCEIAHGRLLLSFDAVRS